jgi:methionine-rich copper-binding protein CopC
MTHTRHFSVLTAGATLLCLVLASVAAAHAKLVSSTPAADAAVSSPKMIQIHFNEAVESKMSSLKLAAADGTPVAIMSMNDPKDPTTLSIMPNVALAAGKYTVSWSAVTDDGHKTKGTFSFSVT